jgi:hypothetical protein
MGLSSLFCCIFGVVGPRQPGRFSRLLGLGLSGCLLGASISLAQAANPSPDAPAPAESTKANSSTTKDDVFTKVISKQKQTEAVLDTYERIQRVEIRKTGSDKEPSEIKVWRLFPAGTGLDKIPLGPDEKPANDESYRAELEKLEKMLVWSTQSGSGQREAYAKVERKRKERTDLIEATHNAFVFTKVGEEMRSDRKLVKYSMTPNPSYKPTTRNGVVFTRVEGTVWVDEQTSELARIEGHVTEDISLALFLAKVYKGSYFMQERYEIFPGMWLPTYEQYDFDGRRFLLSFSIHERTFYGHYRRVGPPKEALEIVRGELNKVNADSGEHGNR